MGFREPIHRCDNCRFWDQGYCKRHAPKAHVIASYVDREGDPTVITETVWPETGPRDFCGDFVEHDRIKVARNAALAEGNE